MKKRNTMRTASVLAVAVLLTASLTSGTLAKYASTKTSAGSEATVAKWSVKVGSIKNSVTNDITGSDAWTFNVFNTVYDTDGITPEKEVTNGKIAPGTSGYVDLYIKNESEVAAKYDIRFKSVNKDKIPLKYAIATFTGNNASRPADGSGWSSDITAITKTASLPVGSEPVGYRFFWKWDIGSADAVTDEVNTADTSLGIAAKATATISAVVAATQAD